MDSATPAGTTAGVNSASLAAGDGGSSQRDASGGDGESGQRDARATPAREKAGETAGGEIMRPAGETDAADCGLSARAKAAIDSAPAPDPVELAAVCPHGCCEGALQKELGNLKGRNT